MKKMRTLASIFALVFLSSCAKDVKDTLDSLECADLISKIDTDDNETCADALADIDKIEKSCGEFLNEETKELIASIRANCTDN